MRRLISCISLLLALGNGVIAFSLVPLRRNGQIRRTTSAKGVLNDHLQRREKETGTRADGMQEENRESEDISGVKSLRASLAAAATLGLAAGLAPFSAGGIPPPAEAVGGYAGGRAGGRAFPSPSVQRSYRAPSSSYRAPAPSVNVYPSYGVSPFGFSPFGFGGFGFGSPFGFGFGPVISVGGGGLSPLLVMGVLAGAYILINSRFGGRAWDDEDEYIEVDEYGNEIVSSFGNGANVVKIQVGLQLPSMARESLLGQLSRIGVRAETGSRDGLSRLVSESCLALLRHPSDWVSASGESVKFGRDEMGKVQSAFERQAMRERSKFEEEEQGYALAEPRDSGPAKGTFAVVTILAAVRGQETAFKKVQDARSLREALELLGGNSMTDQGGNVLAAEVLWTPQAPGAVLDQTEMIADYPELIPV